ncbi:hypothetical protein SAMN05660703_0601 [Cellulophaga tyrosinoxydans]|uniref:Virus attachment protein p12 family protein n=1 Tax=Cellulophaga tyrosinoxydans TaxID=504486 RepID=A0A1W1YKQ9_9FLAO|nr:hypothetical protein SAMN05660703_0601 [Cellulophaga tyrosinoxydans]
MDTLQNILLFITLGIAVGYIVKKFFLPKKFSVTKKQKSCGSSDCGCH